MKKSFKVVDPGLKLEEEKLLKIRAGAWLAVNEGQCTNERCKNDNKDCSDDRNISGCYNTRAGCGRE